MEQVIEILKAAGYVANGQQAKRIIKTVVRNSNDRSGFSPKLVTIGGRLRFAKGKDRVTVGKRTTCFYGEKYMTNYSTKDIDGIRRFLAADTVL